SRQRPGTGRLADALRSGDARLREPDGHDEPGSCSLRPRHRAPERRSASVEKEPWRFAVPPTAHAYGAELAQLYTDLAFLAANSNLPGREWLATCFAGAAFHHVEDVGNQIHTVQVGIYEFFRAAWVQSKLRE